ncbi:MAG: aminopeptidase P N-terminal domain-containing protein [Terriglobia bacterium]
MQGIFRARRCGPLWVLIFTIAWFMLAVALAAAWEREPLSAFQQRRERLAQETADGIVVLYGYDETDVAAATTPFRQNENFYYLTGWNQPGAKMMIVPAADGASAPTQILFIPPRDKPQERWTGLRLDPKDSRSSALTGFPIVMSANRFSSQLQKALKRFGNIYTELTPQPESGEESFQQAEVASLRQLAPSATLADLRPFVTSMRMVKSPGEIALIRKAVKASVDAQLVAMKTVHPGMWEYQVAALIKYGFENEGCEWPSYPPIVGSGFNSTVLHYDDDSRQMQAADVVVIDAAGSYSGYASDITRTLPVDGRFTPRQLEIYNVVLGAQSAAIAAARPGVYLGGARPNSLYRIAFDYINSHGRDLHGHRLGQYFIHGLGHPVGLNVHDPFIPDRPLEPGMIITIEPGVYIPEEKIGVRIEDMILITSNGAETLTRSLPKEPEEIEKIMAQKTVAAPGAAPGMAP